MQFCAKTPYAIGVMHALQTRSRYTNKLLHSAQHCIESQGTAHTPARPPVGLKDADTLLAYLHT